MSHAITDLDEAPQSFKTEEMPREQPFKFLVLLVVMDKGSIVEVGSYEELIRQQGAFYRLERAQMAATEEMDVSEENAVTQEAFVAA